MDHRIAILSDIHGNVTALDTVLKQLQTENITEYWFLGDLLTPGPGVNDIFDRLNNLNLTAFIRGNWDDIVIHIMHDNEKYLDFDNDGYIHVARMVEYLSDTMTVANYQQLKNAPTYKNLTINGLNLQLSHNFTFKNSGHELLPYEIQGNFDELVENNSVDMAFYGHTHHQVMRTTSEDQMIINPGSIGEPYTRWQKFSDDLRAEYAILDIDSSGYSNVSFKRASYDVKAELDLAKQLQLPYIELYDYLLHTGKASTHDLDSLKKYNQQYGYREDVINYFKKLRKHHF
ncbi:metallophosphoesterase family protein [Companilactobacillus sp.]|jgi:putative phosphoesterase|uniref:metallophosphoesterase family protein n=1 Tax=Companilactobacillus sp. TaxID=2767905 RepID=UPI0025C5CA07|nr:metallophosphoesterase family protein [Companilactobacillus sp.]MCH4008272.1 metallophosphatase family protein [Companilactobacillus sp.]MCH4051549.1 metallophosphatase family protein [Companilactobacillus sp.]MCH4076215.1 metallophosphatase family protein [Companilactobacillus sp.]MCH4124790.1 metallophosphatase family protein [Companilactobacillus sp.]MCH4131332.1 metallophosphatase family protein [Companilactobacillus sp.]